MKSVLYALANLLRELNRHSSFLTADAPVVISLVDSLVRAVKRVPGPRVTRLAQVLELLAVDAAEES